MAAPKRLLVLIDELDVGGTEQQILELVKRLDRSKYLPMVGCFRPGRVSKEIEAAGVRVFVLPKRAKVDPRLVLELRHLMQRERIDILQTYLFTANTWGRLAGILAGVPIIVSSERNVDMWEERFKRVIGRALDHWTKQTIANSQAVKDYLIRRGLPGRKVQVIYNGVDPGRFEATPSADATKAELGIPLDHQVVGLLARLEPAKDPHAFLKAAAIVARKISAVSFLVVGGGSLQPALEREAKEMGLDKRALFTGPRRDVPRMLGACDVSVLASVKEGMSNTIMESMSAGKPMVATRVGGNAELVQDGETGFLVPPRDPDALAAAILRIVEDPPQAKAMGRQARVRITHRFSVEAMVASTERLYDDLVRAMPAAREVTLTAPRGDGTIALVASQFPRYVDAYFLREVSTLAARGQRFRILSLRGFDGKIVHQAAKPLLADTLYSPFLLSWPLLRANARFLARTPGRYLGALSSAIGGVITSPRALVRTLAILPKSVYFAERLQEEGITHIHANWASHPATAAFVIARLNGITWSFTGHASDIYVNNAMLAEKIHAASFVVTCTRHNKEYLEGVGGSASARKIVVSYHGVDLARFRPAPRDSGGPFRILTVGTLRDCKGLPDLIEACRMLAERGLSFACTIVGDGEERPHLERLIRDSGLADRVRIVGYLSQEDLIPLYQQASVVALPALSESHFGIPNILLEAFAVETPVVCTALPSLSEVMEDGVHGLYVPERAPRALADAFETLARDPERCRAMGAAGRQQIEALFDSEQNVTVLEELFREPHGQLSTPIVPSLPAPPPAISREAHT